MMHTAHRQTHLKNIRKKEWSKESKNNIMDLKCLRIGNPFLPIRIQMRILLLFLCWIFFPPDS